MNCRIHDYVIVLFSNATPRIGTRFRAVCWICKQQTFGELRELPVRERNRAAKQYEDLGEEQP